VTDLKSWLRATHTNTLNYFLDVLQPNATPANNIDDYSDLISFLEQTKNWGVDGKLLRVWISISVPGAASTDGKGNFESCAVPTKQSNPQADGADVLTGAATFWPGRL
jgi:hypothetical protein